MIVGAIDFGTAYSGWAFSFMHEFKKDPTQVSTKRWNSGTALVTEKAPTCALIASDGETLVAFGYDAENKYRELAKKGKQEKYYYFKGFKMALNRKLDQVLDRYITIEDSLNQSLPAMRVFSLTIGYLVKDMLAVVNDRVSGGIQSSDIHWVLTVPTIWTDSAKQFMTEAACGAGISDGKLTIALEPEAASVYCRYLQLQSNNQEQSAAISDFQVGTKYMVVDAGGGTIDFTVHEVDVTGELKEVYAPGGVGWGGTLVNQAYESFIKDLLTNDVYNKFILNETEDWLDLCKHFETKKKEITPREESKIMIRIPVSLTDLLKRESNQDLETRISASKYAADITLKGDKLRVAATVMKNLFSHSVDKTINHIKTMLRHEQLKGVTALLMVGGFSDSPMLQHAMKCSFPNLKIIIPRDAASVVLKGAVICGHVPDAIKKEKITPKEGSKVTIKKKQSMVVGAIDFGTTYSGWAFSFVHEFKKDPTKVTAKRWSSGAALVTEKAPTCALIASDGETLVAFGYDAENEYRELAEKGEQEKYYFFKGFKMALSKKLDQILDRHITIEDSLNRSLPAMRVFSLTIRYLVKDMLAVVNDRVAGGIPSSDIHWVLTVPAIWTDSAKQFMTEAAIGAGISKEELTIALEPEAASIYCRYIPLQATNQAHKEQSLAISEFQVGTKYMIVDAGGGTIDITVHEVDVASGLKEVHAAGGGGWGGTMVNQAFESFIKDLVTKDIYNKFILNETEDWLDLCRDFETKKKEITPKKGSMITIKIPASLIDLLKETEQDLEKRIIASKYSGDITLHRNKLRVAATIMTNLFSNSVDKTINHIKTILRKVRGITALLMVGGFSDSPMLQHAIKSEFPNIQVIIPRDAASVVLKGAVICGHVPDAIRERTLKYTYGYCCSIAFKEGIHPEANKITTDHGVRCNDAFKVNVKRNDSVTLGQPSLTRIIRPAFIDQTSIPIRVYATQSKPPVVLDQSLTKVGELTLELDGLDGDLHREIEFSLSFLKTTIEAHAKDKSTGKSVKATLNFLG